MLRLSQEIRESGARRTGWHPRLTRPEARERVAEVLEAPPPRLRTRPGGELEPCEWGTALAAFCEGFRRVQGAHGKGAASWVMSHNLSNEELAFSSSLALQGLGFARSAAGSAPTFSPAWEAPEESDVVLLFGPEVASARSPFWQRLSCNRHQPRVISVAPSVAKDLPAGILSYAPQPGSTRTLLHGLANIIIASGWSDTTFIQQKTSDFAAYADLVAQYTTDRVSAETGLEAGSVWDLAQAIGTGERVSFCGRPETAVPADAALRNLALLTGQWGRAGTGICLELEPANELGTHLFAPTASLAQWEEAAAAGKVKALWVLATDANCSPEIEERWAALAQRLDFLVVQGGHFGPLARMADLYLPTTGWQAKEGTRLDPSGRLRLLKPRMPAAGGAMTDFRLFPLIAQYWGCGAYFSRWSSPESAFQILKKTTHGAVHDISEVEDYSTIDLYRPADEPLTKESARLPFQFE